jgi:hypothetical protein
MTHFQTVVILPKGQQPKTKQEAEAFVEPLIAAYDENEQVDPYERACACTRTELIDTQTCTQCNGTGIYESTYNPLSRWDWYVVGGRCSGAFHEGTANETDIELVRNLERDAISSHIVTPDGVWHARGNVGWWGMFDATVSDEDWENTVKGICAEHLDHVAINLDCHI